MNENFIFGISVIRAAYTDDGRTRVIVYRNKNRNDYPKVYKPSESSMKRINEAINNDPAICYNFAHVDDTEISVYYRVERNR